MLNGVIEGFYGKTWLPQDRLTYPKFLRAIGCNTYVYAPKSDVYLRAQWQRAWPEEQRQHLQTLAKTCDQEGIQLGVGLSPLGVSRDFNQKNQQRLEHKLQEINALGVSLLCLLFDDIPGDSDALAVQQVKLCEFVEQHWQGDLVMCPTYYSNDAALAQHFGVRPENYWPTLAAGLSSCWQIFWTGEQVVSLEYHENELQQAAENLGRKPIIWDNYPVNDGRLMWPFLNMIPVDRSILNNVASGVLHNPMNQAWCSKLSLARMKGLDNGLAVLLKAPEPLIAAILADAKSFQALGLEQFTDAQLQVFKTRYRQYEHPLAQEIVAWLNGEYEFDPACLT